MASAVAFSTRMNDLDINSKSNKTTNRNYPNTFRMSMINNNISSSSSNNNVNTTSKTLPHGVSTYCLADIYEDAAVIGSELEKIIINHGPEVLKDLMPKVINVLELLENLTIKNEEENDELNELKVKVNYLEAEKYQKINEREKFEKELEEIEEKWKQETLKLISMVNKLKDENKRLSDSLSQNNHISNSHNDQLIIKQEELDYIRQIKEENIKLKETIKYKDREIEQKNTDHDALQSQIESLSGTMLNLRRKQILAQNQIEKMVQAKTQLECSLTEKDHQLNLVKEKLRIKNINSEEALNEAKSSAISNNYNENNNNNNYKANDSSTEDSSRHRSDSSRSDSSRDPNKDPDRPRFTLKELEKVLKEKNELTIKLDQTQDELEQLKKHDSFNYGDVQGPINKEPDEKLDPANKPTGIRKFLMKLMGSN